MDPGFNITRERSYDTPYANSPLLPLLLASLVMQKHSPRTTNQFKDEYDYVIVGAGSAGSVVASRLSELACVTVLLLEAGESPPVLSEIPALARHFVKSDIDWKYYTAPQRYTAAGIEDRRITWPGGKTLGGSSTINGMLFIIGNRRNYDDWAASGAKGWSYKEVLPYFKKLENNTDPKYLKSGYHGDSGPITMTRPFDNPPVKLAEIEAVKAEKYKFVDPNAREQIGFYDYQASTRNGQRCGTAKAYLVPAENRTNLDIVTNAFVTKVLIENKTAKGVEFDFNGTTHRVKAKREVILSAGAVNTAKLLMLSGIGRMSELLKHKIPLVEDLAVGENLQDHPATLLIYEINSTMRRFDDAIREEENIHEYIHHRTGPLTSSQGFHLASFLRNSDSTKKYIPDFSVYFADFPNIIGFQIGLKPEVLEKLAAAAADKTIVACAVHYLHPEGRGTVSLNSRDPYDPPVIDPNYFQDFRDIKDVVEGMKVCERIMNNPAMKKIGAKLLDFVVPGCEDFFYDEVLYFKCIVCTMTITISHPVGTAKMGDPENDPNAVVDPLLRVKGIKRLRVVDASIMPIIPWFNANIPTIMVAEKGSDIIKETKPCKNKCKD